MMRPTIFALVVAFVCFALLSAVGPTVLCTWFSGGHSGGDRSASDSCAWGLIFAGPLLPMATAALSVVAGLVTFFIVRVRWP